MTREEFIEKAKSVKFYEEDILDYCRKIEKSGSDIKSLLDDLSWESLLLEAGSSQVVYLSDDPDNSVKSFGNGNNCNERMQQENINRVMEIIEKHYGISYEPFLDLNGSTDKAAASSGAVAGEQSLPNRLVKNDLVFRTGLSEKKLTDVFRDLKKHGFINKKCRIDDWLILFGKRTGQFRIITWCGEQQALSCLIYELVKNDKSIWRKTHNAFILQSTGKAPKTRSMSVFISNKKIDDIVDAPSNSCQKIYDILESNLIINHS